MRAPCMNCGVSISRLELVLMLHKVVGIMYKEVHGKNPTLARQGSHTAPIAMLGPRSALVLFAAASVAHGFVVAPSSARRPSSRARLVLTQEGAPPPEGEKSLADKMAGWDASDDERRATTLGGGLPGMVPGLGPPGRDTRTDQPAGMDGFDLGLNLSGIILLPLALLIASVPFWIGSIDVSSVGPPPTS